MPAAPWWSCHPVSEPAGHPISQASHPAGFGRVIQLRSVVMGSNSERLAPTAKAAAQRNIADAVPPKTGNCSGARVNVDVVVMGTLQGMRAARSAEPQ